jgi:hypothetical protein
MAGEYTRGRVSFVSPGGDYAARMPQLRTTQSTRNQVMMRNDLQVFISEDGGNEKHKGSRSLGTNPYELRPNSLKWSSDATRSLD